jgi:hypothetical protein
MSFDIPAYKTLEDFHIFALQVLWYFHLPQAMECSTPKGDRDSNNIEIVTVIVYSV